MRIIQIVENLDKGAVENWLVNVFIKSREYRPDWSWTFYCILGRPGKLDDKVRAAGGNILYSPCTISDKFNFLRALRHTLRIGHYDIIHSHHDFLSGFYLLSTIGISFKQRILHVHNTDEALPVGRKWIKNLLLQPFKWIGDLLSDKIVSISNHTLAMFIKDSQRLKKKSQVLYYGIDFSRFEKPHSSSDIRSSLNIPTSAKLLLFIGRMDPLKNPIFVIDVLNELLKQDTNYIALFVGQGELFEGVKRKAEGYKIEDQIRMLGWREDIVDLLHAADIFIFPRLEEPKEGLGLVVVEAQASGIPILVTKGIVEDAIVIKELVGILPLSSAEEWASVIINKLKKPSGISPAEALQQMKMSRFNLSTSTRSLIELYETPLV
ncbi:MAG: glycosyltransferase [Saprospiraceae bacterium]